MKFRLKKILALTLAITVLVSSHSFAWFEHLCTITQIKTVSFNLETCNGDLAEANATEALTLKKGICCEITFKVNKAGDAIQQNFVFQALTAELLAIPQFRFEPETTQLAEEPALNYSNSSPPLPLPLFILHQQFII